MPVKRQTVVEIPSNLVPYPEAEFCSNLCTRTKVLVAMYEMPMFFIGMGNDIPLVWLSVPPRPRANNLIRLVVSNHVIPQAAELGISVNLGIRRVTVLLDGRPIVEVKEVSTLKASVVLLDLRPFGLKIWGQSDVLHFGKYNLTNNNFVGAEIVMSIK